MISNLKGFDLVFEQVPGDLIGHVLHVNGLYGNLPSCARVGP